LHETVPHLLLHIIYFMILEVITLCCYDLHVLPLQTDMSIIRWHLWAPVIILLVVHSTSGQLYPNCGGGCQRDGECDMFSIIIT